MVAFIYGFTTALIDGIMGTLIYDVTAVLIDGVTSALIVSRLP